jgi:hypothetical protein
MNSIPKDRLTQKAKDINNKQWYKDKIESFDKISSRNFGFGGIDENKKMKANYDLFNDKIDIDDFKHIVRPYGEDLEDNQLPADFRNRDIISGKIKALHGIEFQRPLSHKIVAVNDEATNRREQEEFRRIQHYVISQIMKPIELQIRKQYEEETKGRQLAKEELAQLEAKIQEELKAQTPEEVKIYMKREHQDPAEVMMSQLFNYIVKEQSVIDKFNKMFFHGSVSAYEVCWIGVINDVPVLQVVNPLYFNCDKSPDTDYIEDGEWGICEWRLSPSQVISFFGSELTDEEIDEIYELNAGTHETDIEDNFIFIGGEVKNIRNVRVFHATWKSLKKIGFLTYKEDNQVLQTIVDENYKLQPEDIKIEWEWIPEVHEGYKIGNDIYKLMRPVIGQYKSLDNIYNVKLPYHGAIHDNVNSEPVSLLDRMKPWQYYYNIIMYRIEMLMASDKGKIMLMNMNLIPKSEGITLDKWLYYADALKIGFMNPSEEGNKTINTDVTNSVKEIDMSLVSDIEKYIRLAEYIEQKTGRVVGITPEIEGQIANSALVGNTQQNIAMASNIISPYFKLHDMVKKNVLTSLLELAKYVYSSEEGRKKLVYVLDDMSLEMLSIDAGLLEASTFGFFMGDSNEGFETKQVLQQLAQAAIQNDKAELSDIVKIIKSTSIQETEELLKTAEEKAREREIEIENVKTENQKQLLEQQEAFAEKQHQRELEKIQLKGEIDLQKQAMLSMGFNEDKDIDKDGEIDIMEVYRKGKETEIKDRQQNLKEKEFEYKKQFDERKLAIEKLKASKSNKQSDK